MNAYTGSIPASPRATSWLDKAACRGEDPELFFAHPTDHRAVEQAKAICARCPVSSACLTTAVTEQLHGVWGGLTAQERAAIRRNAYRRHLPIESAIADRINPQTTTIDDLYDRYTRTTDDGHIVWEHPDNDSGTYRLDGVTWTRNRISWLVHHDNAEPTGHVVRTCERLFCVVHLADSGRRHKGGIKKKAAAA